MYTQWGCCISLILKFKCFLTPNPRWARVKHDCSCFKNAALIWGLITSPALIMPLHLALLAAPNQTNEGAERLGIRMVQFERWCWDLRTPPPLFISLLRKGCGICHRQTLLSVAVYWRLFKVISTNLLLCLWESAYELKVCTVLLLSNSIWASFFLHELGCLQLVQFQRLKI